MIRARWSQPSQVDGLARCFRSTGSAGPRRLEKALTQTAGRARQELKAMRLEIALTGRASERTLREIPKTGWTVLTADVKR